MTTTAPPRPRNRPLHTIANPRKSLTLTLVTALFALYCLLPLVWLVINATKTQPDFVTTPGLAPGHSFALLDNIGQVFTYNGGIFVRWLLNTLLYVVVGASVSTALAALGGYSLAKLRFTGKRAFLFVVLGSISVPGIALAIPQFLLFAQLGLTNTPWAVLLPSFLNPFGLYLMWVFAAEAVPGGLLEAAEIDGAGPFRTFWRIGVPLLGPATVTVLLFSVVSIWNNYFLPLIMLKDPAWYPLTIGINQWNKLASTAGNGELLQNLVITSSLLTIVPLILAFVSLQRYWQSGLALGAVKG
ncbi:MAG: carbohydrate ABC transporter permease [Cellulomonas iranensis]|uniref:Multiple sugar transport system permease protein n=1 Tax=Cellulomonas iranensis TaxID=76862 RepID=A0ABU0GJ99_9CELL|nr:MULTISPECIES: carbohydrate ABC transporter permease [Cellulomonas]MBO9569606.1 carbohydrate ABC transporter permease [Cellulomonas iranensis]MDQ0425398.1 multiple sugar transport system permease protein [Cellulomonas iranensis]TFH71080.1 carbohydrate ABC transporter permease [Cellulomonas sp. HD19AZ1]UCN14820.1 carbohydrate ABC transporter permease [Cellulomonas iranensis]